MRRTTAFAFGLFLTAATPAFAAAPPLVQTSSGPVQGIEAEGSTWAWLGLPFAAPPEGALRWQAPQDPPRWTTPRLADTFGAICPQMTATEDPLTGETSMQPGGAEDCLTLNVWRPSSASPAPRPVMVWIHGGGNTTGAASIPLYDGARLAATEDVVVVSIQYRLSLFGYLSDPALATGDADGNSGNFGLLDQVKALEWVQENAAAFGGDAGRVTVFGESAGGFDTWALILSPRADGLFHRAIIQSGCPLFIPIDQARATAAAIVEALVVADGLATPETAAAYVAAQGPAWRKSYLYGQSADALLQAPSDAGLLSIMSFYAIEDGRLIPTDGLDHLISGDFTGVPTIIGSNRDEMKLFMFAMYPMGPAIYHQAMAELYGDQVDEIEALYPRRSYTQPLFYNRFTDVQDWFLELMCGTWAATLVAPHQPTWLYQFRYDELVEPYDQMIGAGHATELPFVFGHLSDDLYADGTQEERAALSSKMMGYWGCMAETGEPDACPGTDPWPQLTLDGVRPLERMRFDDVSGSASIPGTDEAKMEYWASQGGLDAARVQSPGFDGIHQSTVGWLAGGAE